MTSQIGDIQFYEVLVKLRFSRPYTYCDTEGDVDLVTFNLTHDDHLYKIPYIQMAKEMSGKEVHK